MRKRDMTERRFKCSGCNSIQSAPKSSSHRTSEGHTKHMYCVFCKDVKPFTQITYVSTLADKGLI